MAAKPPPAEFPTLFFASAAEFTTFLAQEHASAPGLFLQLAKKSSGIQSITAPEAVEVALCYGWIDGRVNPIDAAYFTIRFTPRRAKSIWSLKNVNTVARLIADGRMQPAGLEKVEDAKRDGRWERAYAAGKVPEDLEAALEGDKAAKGAWEALGKSQRSTIIYKIATAGVKGRERFIETVVEGLKGDNMTASNQKPKPQGKGAAKTRKATVTKGVKPTGVIKEKASKKITGARSLVSPKAKGGGASSQQDQVERSRREGLRPRS